MPNLPENLKSKLERLSELVKEVENRRKNIDKINIDIEEKEKKEEKSQ